jgi:hypothetical protein
LIGSPALVVPAQYPAGAAGQIRHIGTPLVQDQVEAGAQVVPPFLQRLDPGVAAADFEGDCAGRKGQRAGAAGQIGHVGAPLV